MGPQQLWLITSPACILVVPLHPVGIPGTSGDTGSSGSHFQKRFREDGKLHEGGCLVV